MPNPGQRLDAETATKALEELPIERREVVIARLWGGLSFDEIALLVGTSNSTAHRRYWGGLETLRERFGATCSKKDR